MVVKTEAGRRTNNAAFNTENYGNKIYKRHSFIEAVKNKLFSCDKFLD